MWCKTHVYIIGESRGQGIHGEPDEARGMKMLWDAERFEVILMALLKGDIELEDVSEDFARIESYREAGVLTKDRGLVIKMSDGKRITISIR